MCNTYTGDCSCAVGYTGPNCDVCSPNFMRFVPNGACYSIHSSSLPRCSDGVRNGDEEGVDCGGAVCPQCESASEYTILTFKLSRLVFILAVIVAPSVLTAVFLAVCWWRFHHIGGLFCCCVLCWRKAAAARGMKRTATVVWSPRAIRKFNRHLDRQPSNRIVPVRPSGFSMTPPQDPNNASSPNPRTPTGLLQKGATGTGRGGSGLELRTDSPLSVNGLGVVVDWSAHEQHTRSRKGKLGNGGPHAAGAKTGGY